MSERLRERLWTIFIPSMLCLSQCNCLVHSSQLMWLIGLTLRIKSCKITQPRVTKLAISCRKKVGCCCFIQKEPSLYWTGNCYFAFLVIWSEGGREWGVRRGGKKLRRRRDLERSLYLQLYFYPGYSLSPLSCFPKQSYTRFKRGGQTSARKG